MSIGGTLKGANVSKVAARTRSGTRRAAVSAASEIRRRVEPLIFPEASGGEDQWQRVVMNEAVDRQVRSLRPPTRTAAEISGDAESGKGWKEYRSLNYPEFDLCAPLTDQQRYDVVICEQVLEHVEDPFLAAEHLFEMCKPGGHAIVSTPFLIKVHELPLYGLRDFWRFTPRGLRTLLERAGFEVESVATWGNRLGVVGNLDRWSAHRRWLPLKNRPDLAVVVWAFARRPAS